MQTNYFSKDLSIKWNTSNILACTSYTKPVSKLFSIETML